VGPRSLPELPAELLYDNDELARLPADRLAARQLELLRPHLRALASDSPYYRRVLADAGLAPDGLRSVADLVRLPVVRKEEIAARQKAAPPFGDFSTVPREQLVRVFVHGQTYYPFTRRDLDQFVEGAAKAQAAAGPGGPRVVDVTASFNWVAGGTLALAAADRLGATVVPGGAGMTDQHIQVLRDLGVTSFGGFPSFVRHVALRARELGLDPRRDFAVRHLGIGGEVRSDDEKRELGELYGATVTESYGTTETGLMAAECSEGGGMHLFGHHVVELLDPESGEPRPLDQPGEIVATSVLPREAMPLLRYATGDVTEGFDLAPCRCGRLAPRLRRITGRRGEILRVKGLFLYPGRVAAALARVPGAGAFVSVVERRGGADAVTVRVELPPIGEAEAEAARARLREAIKATTNLTVDVELVAPGTFPPGSPRAEDRRLVPSPHGA